MLRVLVSLRRRTLHDTILSPGALWLPRWLKRVTPLGAAALRSVSGNWGNPFGVLTEAPTNGSLGVAIRVLQGWLSKLGSSL